MLKKTQRADMHMCTNPADLNPRCQLHFTACGQSLCYAAGAVRGAQIITSKAVVICYFPIFLYKIWLNLVYSYFANPRVCAMGLILPQAATGIVHITASVKKKPEPDSLFWAPKPGVPPLWFICFPLHSPKIEPRYNNSILGLFLLQKQRLLNLVFPAVWVSVQQLLSRCPEGTSHHKSRHLGSLWTQLRKGFDWDLAT